MARKQKEIPGVIMDADDLSEKASSRRVRQEVEYKPEWKCEYCQKVLANETYFMKHSCREKERSLELATPVGHAAYLFYCDWMKYYKRKPPSVDTFGTSRYYTTFVEFARHVKKLSIGDPSKFLELMCTKDISPMLWRRDQCYTMYLEWIDKKQDPLEQVKNSIEELLDLCDKENVENLSDIFAHLGTRRLAELIRLRKLSPWFLFCSKGFGDFIKSVPKDESSELSAIMNPEHWTKRFQDSRDIVKEIMQINREMGL